MSHFSMLRVLSALPLLAVPVEAQVIRGEIGASVGASTDQRGVKSNAFTLAPSVLLVPDERVNLSLGASSTRFGAASSSLGGAAGLNARIPMSTSVAFSAAGSASYTSTSFNARYGLLDVTPSLEGTVGGVTLFAGAHVANGWVSVREVSAAPQSVPGLPVNGATRDVHVTRASAGPVFGGVVSLTGAPMQSAVVVYREEHAHVAGANVIDRAATTMLSNGPMSVSLTGGMRDARDERLGYGTVGATYALTSSLTLQASGGTYPSNRVLATSGGSFASIGFSLHGARRMADAPAAPVLRGAPPLASGMTRLVVRAADARRVEIAGDFNGWTPAAAMRADDGFWYADVRLTPGEYRYAFKVDGARWVTPTGSTSVDDGFGGRSALITVR